MFLRFIPLILFSTQLLAEEINLSVIEDLERKLPTQRSEKIITTQPRKYDLPRRVVSLEEITSSPLLEGALRSGIPLFEIETQTEKNLTKTIYVKYHRIPDEFGNFYLVNKKNQITHKVSTNYLVPIQTDLDLYPKPHFFSEAPVQKKKDQDFLLKLDHEVFAQLGVNQGNYFKDLANKEMSSGDTIIAGYQFVTRWKLSLKVGSHLKYEKSSFLTKDGTTLTYTSPTIGASLRTKDFDLLNTPVRFQTMFGVSPFSRLIVLASDKSSEYKFNAFDLNNSIQFTFENSLGEWSLGLFHQAQWLNIRSQSDVVSIKANNRVNTSFGLHLSQVFL